MTRVLRYSTGEMMHLGDQVVVDGMSGMIKCVISSGEFSEEFTAEHWSYLEHGFMFKSDSGILIHFSELDESTLLVSNRQS